MHRFFAPSQVSFMLFAWRPARTVAPLLPPNPTMSNPGFRFVLAACLVGFAAAAARPARIDARRIVACVQCAECLAAAGMLSEQGSLPADVYVSVAYAKPGNQVPRAHALFRFVPKLVIASINTLELKRSHVCGLSGGG